MTRNYSDFLKLKSNSGLHSPSVFELKNRLNIEIEIDACFLCNPYAFDLFIKYLNKRDLQEYIKYYPPQNSILSKILSNNINIDSRYLMIGNGAIQLIELIMREFQGKKKCIITPTFSSYYEYDENNIFFFQTYKENNFLINKFELIKYCKENKIEILVIVNPNNPTGAVINKFDLKSIIQELNSVSIIVDESFIDFYDINQSVENDVYENKNLIVIRSLSKDFGIAGLRLGYSVCHPEISANLFKKYGLCWNINGLAQFFLETMGLQDFQNEYKQAREKYLLGREDFFKKLQTLKKLKVYSSNANFFIIDCEEKIDDVFSRLLFDNKIYTRILNDKLHLDISFIRIACNKIEENTKVFEALKIYEELIY